MAVVPEILQSLSKFTVLNGDSIGTDGAPTLTTRLSSQPSAFPHQVRDFGAEATLRSDLGAEHL
jgi:hypothetical protein